MVGCVETFDQNSNIYLEPVSINVTNQATSEVLVENTFKAHQVHTAVDDIEVAIVKWAAGIQSETAAPMIRV